MKLALLALAPLAVAVAATLTACPQTPTPVTPPPDATDAQPAMRDARPVVFLDASVACEDACVALQTVGCPLGSQPDCPTFLQTLQDSKQQPNPKNGNKPLTCAAIDAIKTKADAQALGFACP